MERLEQRRQNFYLFAFIIIIGTTCNLIFNLMQGKFHHPIDVFPWSAILFHPWDRFNDLFNWIRPISEQPEIAWAMPPLSMFVATCLRWTSGFMGKAELLALTTLLQLFLFVWTLKKTIQDKNDKNSIEVWFFALFTILTSYPVFFNIDRGNIAGYVVSFCLLGLLFLLRGRPAIAMTLWTIPVNLKIVPVIFGAFLWRKGERKNIFIFVSLCFVLTFFSAFVFKFIFPEYSLALVQKGMALYFNNYALGGAGLAWGSSFLGGEKVLLYLLHGPLDYSATLDRYIHFMTMPCHLFTLIFIGTGLKEIKQETQLDQIVLVTTWLILAPFVMADYYLTFLFIPFAFLLGKFANHPQAKLYICLIAFALIPKTYFWWSIQDQPVSLSVLLNPLIILVLFLRSAYNVYTK